MIVLGFSCTHIHFISVAFMRIMLNVSVIEFESAI